MKTNIMIAMVVALVAYLTGFSLWLAVIPFIIRPARIALALVALLFMLTISIFNKDQGAFARTWYAIKAGIKEAEEELK